MVMKADDRIIKLVLPADLRRQFKTLCSSEGTNMTEKLLGFIKEELEKQHS